MADVRETSPDGRRATAPGREHEGAPAWAEACPSRRRPDDRGKPDHSVEEAVATKTADDEQPVDRDGGAHSGDDAKTQHRNPPPANAPRAGRRRAWLWAAAAAAILVLLGGGVYRYRSPAAAPGGGAKSGQQRAGGKVPVEVVEVRIADLPLYLNGLGTVQAFNNVVIRSRVDGEVQAIAFEEGQMVKAGDLLAQIDARPYQAALDQAVAGRAQNQARLASARLDLERTRQLAGRGFAPLQTLDQQTANVRTIEAQVASDAASIGAAQTQLGYTTIRAPIAGRTGLRLVDQGNIVRATDQTGIVEIAQLQPIAVVFTAPEGELRPIARAMKDGLVQVTAFTSDRSTALDTGRLALVNNEVDAASGTIRLKAVFDNGADRLWPGLSVVTRLLERTLTNAVAVPADAVQRGQNELFVYTLKDGDTVEKRVVKVGPFTEGMAVIEDGLRPGERVVVAGQYRLKPGAEVEPKTRDQGNPAQTSGGNERAAERAVSSGG